MDELKFYVRFSPSPMLGVAFALALVNGWLVTDHGLSVALMFIAIASLVLAYSQLMVLNWLDVKTSEGRSGKFMAFALPMMLIAAVMLVLAGLNSALLVTGMAPFGLLVDLASHRGFMTVCALALFVAIAAAGRVYRYVAKGDSLEACLEAATWR